MNLSRTQFATLSHFLMRAVLAGCAALLLFSAVSAQALRSPNDVRNQSPAVGTGGPAGGPTGLFTIYDGDTLRRGEFTFSIAYSNFDRDPGDVDITEVPLSFNIGLSDHIELFFQTTAYRGVKVNSPLNLSSFYLPNSQVFFGAGLLGSPSAIILPPERVSGATITFSQVVRPAFCPACIGRFPQIGPAATAQTFFFLGGQPFLQFPFIGGVGPTLGIEGSNIAPRFVSRIGQPTGGGGNFGHASSFPGMGSPAGSILPGIVLSVRTIPANLTFNTLVVPEIFTSLPSYLPDAPFINRLYGQSSFGTMQLGAKIRFTGPNNPLGVGIIPFYRWNLDKADDFSGFNQLQRGASGGGNLGDFGLIAFVSGRLSQHVNVSANMGYILNSNPTSKAMSDATLLDRPDEWLAGVGFDFPVNEHFQIIGEVRSTKYVAGSTPNAFNNNPVEAIGGLKIYPRRWWGFGGAYRRHLNPQDSGRFNDPLPAGFRPSEDPNGFMGQVWVGRRNPRSVPPPPNREPTGSVSASTASLVLPCPPGTASVTCTPSSNMEVQLTALASDPDNDTLLYTWSVTGGRLSGDGRAVTWDLSGVQAGTYTASVEVNDGNNHIVPATTTVGVTVCTDCAPPCPQVSVSCASDVEEGSPITFTASVVGGDSNVSATYNWSVSAGTISSGQGTSTITVDTTGIGGQTVTASVEVGGYQPACATTASCSTQVRTVAVVEPRKFDEYGEIRFNDEKARLDNFAIELQNQPGAEGHIIAYGKCAGEGQARADRAKNYLVNTRGIDAARVFSIDGGCREDLTVELWIRPTGARAPEASGATLDPCPDCRRPRRRRTRRSGDE